MALVREIAGELDRWRARGERFALAAVVATRRSAPRPVGAKLAVSERGELVGSVSGGCVEADVCGHAQDVLAGGAPRLVTYGISDDAAFEVGLPCGGEIDVFIAAPADGVVACALDSLASESRAVLATVVAGDGLGMQQLVEANGARVGADDGELAAYAPDVMRGGRSRLDELGARTVFFDVMAPPPKLLIFGAVDTAEALCRATAMLGWRTVVADARARFATRERLPSAGEILVAWPEDVLALAPPDESTAVVVLTHDDRFDIPAIRGALASDAFYVGALGSRRNQERRRERLLAAGVGDDALERLSGPCGLDIGAATPAETALSILAEILAARAGREGGRLTNGRQRIHADIG